MGVPISQTSDDPFREGKVGEMEIFSKVLFVPDGEQSWPAKSANQKEVRNADHEDRLVSPELDTPVSLRRGLSLAPRIPGALPLA